jgi:hypothetical protein
MDKTLKRNLAEFVLGKRKTLVLEGSPVLIAVIYEAAMASRELLITLENKDIDGLSAALSRKKEAVNRFREHTGQNWSI